jgi:hypothetical protein
MNLDEEGMGWHSFKRFRKTWLRGQRCLEDINNFWMAHKPQTMSEVYSHLHEDLQLRLDEAQRVGYGFALPTTNASVVPIVPKSRTKTATEKAAQTIVGARIKLVDVTGFEPATPCLQSVNQVDAIEYDGELPSSVFLGFTSLHHSPRFLPSAMVSYPAVHQIVHQVWHRVSGELSGFLSCPTPDQLEIFVTLV